MIIDGKKIAEGIYENLSKEISNLKNPPELKIIQVGSLLASNIYVAKKQKIAKKLGINAEVIKLENSISENELIAIINQLNSLKCGIIVQLPLPKEFNTQKIINTINYKLDVDGLTFQNLGLLFSGTPHLISCTPLGILKLLKSLPIKLSGKHAVIIGRSNLVGKPLIPLLLSENCTVTSTHSHTVDLKSITKTADILICAIGRANFIDKSYIKKDAIVIDVGINRNNDNHICGDVNFEDIKNDVSFITPVPGGVGPMTVAMLMHNTVQVAKNFENENI